MTATLSKYDQRRKDTLLKTLQKAREQVETALLYLNVNADELERVMDFNLVKEHIEIAIDHLEGS